MAGKGRPRRYGRVREAAAPRYAPESPPGVAGVLYDSDVIIEVLRGRAGVIEAVRALEASGVPTYCSAITLAEVYAGLRPGEESVTQAFFEVRGEVVLDADAGRRAGGYLAMYGRSHGVQIADALVAAAASTAGLHLWTLNPKHYPMADVRFYKA